MLVITVRFILTVSSHTFCSQDWLPSKTRDSHLSWGHLWEANRLEIEFGPPIPVSLLIFLTLPMFQFVCSGIFYKYIKYNLSSSILTSLVPIKAVIILPWTVFIDFLILFLSFPVKFVIFYCGCYVFLPIIHWQYFKTVIQFQVKKKWYWWFHVTCFILIKLKDNVSSIPE